MRKIYSFIAMMLMCFVGSANAQSLWGYLGGEETNVSEIVAGPDHYYVLKGGANTKEDGTPGKDFGGTQAYLGVGGKSDVPKHNCVYNIIEADETHNGFQVYMLKNVSNESYLKPGGGYSPFKAEAWKFTIRKAVEMGEGSSPEKSGWDNYSHAVSETRSQGAQAMGAWVFCDLSAKKYMCFYGNPAMASYTDTNNWLIIEVVEEGKVPEFEKLLETFEKYNLGDYENGEAYAETFLVGENPGCVSQEFVDHVIAVFNQAIELLNSDNQDEALCKAANEALIKLFEEEIEANTRAVAPGYFLLVNQRSQDLAYANGNKKMVCQRGVSELESYTLDAAKYIWEVEASGVEGKFFFKNWGTNLYIGKTPGLYQAFGLVADTVAKVTPSHYSGDLFLLQGGNGEGEQEGFIHNDGSYKCVPWNSTGTGNQWRFVPVNADSIAKLDTLVKQSILNQDLKSLVETAQSDYNVLKCPTFIEANSYNAPADSGLVTSLIQTNADQKTEGGIDKLFDGKLDTYFHSAWQDTKVTEQGTAGKHWIKVDLGKELTELTIKFSKRQNAANGHIRQYALYKAESGELDENNLAEDQYGTVVATSDDTIKFQYGKSTHIAKYTLSEPTRYLRFVVLHTIGKDTITWDKMTAGTGPFWHMSEFRCYDKTATQVNPGFEAISQDLKDALLTAIENAQAELADKKATQETYDALESALENLWDAYPDPDKLVNALKNANQIEGAAQESEELGFYQTGAKEELRAVIDELQKFMDDKSASKTPITLVELNDALDKLDAALKVFNSKLNKPETGIYQIVSTAGNELNEDGSNKTDDKGNVKERAQNESCISSVNADYKNGTPVWRYKFRDGVDVSQKFNTLWYVEKTEKGYSFKNLANGLYMNNPYEGLTEDSLEKVEIPAALGYSMTPKYFDFESYSAKFYEAGSFLITMGFDQYVNLQPTGDVVHYSDPNDPHAPFTLKLVEETAISNTHYIDVTPGRFQILSMAMPIDAIYPAAGDGYYVVKGMKDNKIYLENATEAIPAGTPFIVQTAADDPETEEADGESTLETEILGSCSYDAIPYNYDVKKVNGLVSAPFGFKTTKETSFGVLVNNTVLASKGGHNVAAGSGYFNNEIPAYEGEPTADEPYLVVEGEIKGDLTGVDNVTIVKNVPTDVYSISGVKVRSNVKAAAATKNLPKGIYIVGGKKVVVK